MPFGDAAQCGHDLAGRAVAALECVLVDERLLQRVKFAALGKTLDGGDVRAVMHHRKRQAGVDPPTIDQHRAGTAGSLVAAFLGARQPGAFAQHVQQRGAVVDGDLALLAVDLGPYHRGVTVAGIVGSAIRSGYGGTRSDGPAERDGAPDKGSAVQLDASSVLHCIHCRCRRREGPVLVR
ncbi:hypothetical protein AWC13_19135 [Mycobacterium kubicae]|nr:hypothetical protein AWC13_19135 [Mycobacterium kubicae]